ncbi:MAG: hypothetical protein AAF456_21390 [Planctomycetota bacterium]
MATVTVEIRPGRFVPDSIAIEQGDSIVWLNRDDSRRHNAKGIGTGIPNTVDLTPGQNSAPQVFNEATDAEGIRYQCTIHPEMEGTIVVSAGSGGGGGQAPPTDLRVDFTAEEWQSIGHAIAAAWAYDLSDDIEYVLRRHRVADDDSRSFIRETHDYVRQEWDAIEQWWRELVEEPEATFFDPEKTLLERRDYLMQHSRDRLEALGRKLRAAKSTLRPLVGRWPDPARPDDEGGDGVLFPEQSTSAFGKAITINDIDKPFQDAYMDHQNFAIAAYRIELRTDLGRPVDLSLIRDYLRLKQTMNPVHYKFLALHQYRGIASLWEGSGLNISEFIRHMWSFCVRGEMDAPEFGWWQWLRWIDAHIAILETGSVPHIIDLPDEIEEPDSGE